MRTSTFVVSFIVHALLIGGAVVARVVATGELPEPPRASTFMIVTPDVPEIPPPPRPPESKPSSPAVNPDAAPIVEPTVLAPEPIGRIDDAPVADGLIPGGAVPGGPVPSDVIAPPRVVEAEPRNPVRVGGDIRPPQKIHHVSPEYPAIARSARVSGIVILEALIAEDGSVREVRVLRSVPLLDAAAVDAVRGWRFTPTLLNGTPVPVLMTVTVSFDLR